MLIIIAREEMYLLCKNTFKFYDKELVRGGQNMLSKVKRRFCFTEVSVNTQQIEGNTEENEVICEQSHNKPT